MKKVTIYSTPTCHYCNLAKDYFKKNRIDFTAYDVASDIERRREMMTKSGQLGVPVILVDDQVIVGFDKSRLTQLLSII